MANEAVMAALHDAVVKELLARIENGTATAADMSVARGLLKDSSITCTPAAGNSIGELEQKLNEKREAREARRRARLKVVGGSDMPLDFDAAGESFAFMVGEQ